MTDRTIWFEKAKGGSIGAAFSFFSCMEPFDNAAVGLYFRCWSCTGFGARRFLFENLINHIASILEAGVESVLTEYGEMLTLVPVYSNQSSFSFGFPEFITLLAVLLVVLSASDYQTKYRFSLMRFNVKKWALIVSASSGTILLVFDVAEAFAWQVPSLIANADVWRAAIAVMSLVFIVYLIYCAVIRVPKYTTALAGRFLTVHHRIVMRGDKEELRVLADNLGHFILDVIRLSNQTSVRNGQNKNTAELANTFLYLLENDRLSAVVANTRPDLICLVFKNIGPSDTALNYLAGFCNGAAWALIEDETSALHQECSSNNTGLLGYFGDVGKAVFGQVDLVEELGRSAYSPLDLPYLTAKNLNEKQYQAYMHGAKIFVKALIESSQSRYRNVCQADSYVFNRLLDFGRETWLSHLEGTENPYEDVAFTCFRARVEFIRFIIEELGAQEIQATQLRVSKRHYSRDIYDKLAHCIVELIPRTADVRNPTMTAWMVQYNTFWSEIFKPYDEKIEPVTRQLGFKVRRLIYEKIRKMSDLPDFEAARLIAFCLNVFGLKLVSRQSAAHEPFYALQKMVLLWAEKHFADLYEERQVLAEACLTGGITYDQSKNCLVKTFSSILGAPPKTQELKLRQPSFKLQ